MACEDPSSVGLGLVGDDSGQPITQAIEMTTFQASDDSGIIDNNGEVFVGMVEDPTLGTTVATGYLDFQSNTTLTTAYRNGTIERAFLRLQTSYMYGDTLSQMTIAVHEVLREFTGIGSNQDSIPEVGPELFQFDISPTDSLIDVELPESWVMDRDSDLRATNFGTLFPGFQLVPVSGNAVISFLNNTTADAGIYGVVGSDSVRYRAIKSISQFQKTAEGVVPENLLPFQNGVGPKITFSFDFGNLEDVALNRIAVRIPQDTLAFDTPANFFRPTTDDISLHGVLEDSSSVLLAIASPDSDGFYNFASDTFHNVFQQFLLGTDPYETYEIRFAGSSSSSINGLLIHDVNSTEKPEVFVTYTILN